MSVYALYVYACVYVFVCVYVCMCMYMCRCMYVHAYICVSVCMCLRMWCICVYVYYLYMCVFFIRLQSDIARGSQSESYGMYAQHTRLQHTFIHIRTYNARKYALLFCLIR